MLYDDWLDIPCVCHSSDLVAPILERLNTRRKFFTIILICSIHKVMLQIIKSSCYDLISAYFRTLSLSLGNHQFMSAKWFPLQRWPISNQCLFIIDICIDNCPFKAFINRKEEGVGDLECGDVGETNGLGKCYIWAWSKWSGYEINSMLINVWSEIHVVFVGYFKRKQKNPQAHGYRCSLHPGVFQSIDFPQGTWVY